MITIVAKDMAKGRGKHVACARTAMNRPVAPARSGNYTLLNANCANIGGNEFALRLSQ
jgi:hypothetical protein